MTSFRRHLQRLAQATDASANVGPDQGHVRGAAVGEPASRAEPEGAYSTAERRAQALIELRQKMGDLLAETALRVTEPTPSSGTSRVRLSAEDREAEAQRSLAVLVPWRSTSEGGFHCQSLRLEPGTQWGNQQLIRPSETRFQVLTRLCPRGLDPSRFERCLFLDTETTGLGTGSGVLPFLVGLGWFEGDAFVTEQLILSSPAQEPALLRYLAERVAAAPSLITFNGKSFDWPLLETRFILNRLRAPRLAQHLDLYHLGRRVHKARLGRCNLKRLEAEVLGFQRLDDIEGAEVAMRYQRFLQSADASELDAVLEHNRLDVVSMAALVSLYGDPSLGVAHRDALGVARSLKQNGEHETALQICSAALARASDDDLLHLRAELYLSRGEREQAVQDLALLPHCPKARFRLAKLYEHHFKRPDLALDQAQLGTTEAAEAAQRRLARLAIKLARMNRRNAARDS